MPQFQGSVRTHAQSTLEAKERATSTREGHAQSQMDAVATMTQRYADEVAATG
jgi:limonene 1,2-monooxygenase